MDVAPSAALRKAQNPCKGFICGRIERRPSARLSERTKMALLALGSILVIAFWGYLSAASPKTIP
jgi:hypothetical protein